MLKWHERYSVGRSLSIQKQAFGGKNMICGPSRVTAVVFSHEMNMPALSFFTSGNQQNSGLRAYFVGKGMFGSQAAGCKI